MNESRFCRKLTRDDLDVGMYVTILKTDDGEPIEVDTEKGKETVALECNPLETYCGRVLRIDAICYPYLLVMDEGSGELVDVDFRRVALGELNEQYVATLHAYMDYREQFEEEHGVERDNISEDEIREIMNN